MDEFIRARSMLAPGIAGATTTLITGTLVTQFDSLPGNWTALIISFLIGLVILGDRSVSGGQRILLYFINSLIIFSVASGINTAGVAATQSRKPATRVLQPAEMGPKPFFHEWF